MLAPNGLFNQIATLSDAHRHWWPKRGFAPPFSTTYDTLDGRTFEGVVLSSVNHAQAEGSAFDTAKLHPTLLELP